MKLLSPIMLILFLACTEKKTEKSTPTDSDSISVIKGDSLEICVYDTVELAENFKRANPELDFSKGRPPKPPKPSTNSGYSCLYIDFDGEVVKNSYWNSGNTLNCAPANLTVDQKAQVMFEVSELFKPLNLTITDSVEIFNKANSARRIRIIVTPTSYWYGGVSGISYVGSFSWGNGTPAFVFSDKLYNGPHYIAEIIAHEAGHTLGLRHQSEYNPDCTLKYTYRMGWVMGNSLYTPQGSWANGTTTSCNTFQDGIPVMATVVGYR